MEAGRRMVAGAKGGMDDLVDGSCRDTFDSYASIRQNVDQSLLIVRNRLKKIFDREAKRLQKTMHDALRDAAGGVQQSCFDAREVVNRSLASIVGQSKRDEAARPRSCLRILRIESGNRVGQGMRLIARVRL